MVQEDKLFDLYRLYTYEKKPTKLVPGDEMLYFPGDGTIAFFRGRERLEFGHGNTTTDKRIVGHELDGYQLALVISATCGLTVRDADGMTRRSNRYQFR